LFLEEAVVEETRGFTAGLAPELVEEAAAGLEVVPAAASRLVQKKWGTC
jgi:hypothetical protein